MNLKKMKVRIRKMAGKAGKWLMSDSEGYTYTETVICIAIMLILTVAVGAASLKLIDNAKEAKCRREIEEFRTALEEYYSECGMLPTTEQGLSALWTKPVLYPVPSKWNGPYLNTEVPPDPWGREYYYRVPGTNGLRYEIFSYGSDGEKGGSGTAEDIYSWKRR